MNVHYFSVPCKSLQRTLFYALFLSFFICAIQTTTLASGYEQVRDFTAREILTPEQISGPYHQVGDTVHYDGLFFRFRVETPFGRFTPGSTFALNVLIGELNAIAEMKKVETSDTAIESMKASGRKTFDGLASLVADPVDTVTKAGQGVGSLFTRAGGTIGRRQTTATEDSLVAQALGFSKSKGVVASKFGVSVYSENPVLQQELERLAWADYLGGLSVGAVTSVVPGVGGVILTVSGTARLLNDVINTTPASQLWLDNKSKLTAMGVHPYTVELFLNNRAFSPALATVMTAALQSMEGVPDREIFIKIGLQASTFEMARAITELTVLLAGYHQNIAPLSGFAPIARIAHGIRQDGASVVVLPIDHLIWSEHVAGLASDLSAHGDAAGGGGEIWILGTVSAQAGAALAAAGWNVHERAGKSLLTLEH